MELVQTFLVVAFFALVLNIQAQTDQLHDKLFEGVMGVGDIDKTRDALRAGANPNATNKYGVTPLLFASRTGNPLIISELLLAGADPYYTHEDGGTPLGWAAYIGHKETVELLLDFGVDPNSSDNIYGKSALHSTSYPEVAVLLLANGADPDAVDKSGNTPLHDAACIIGRNMEMVRLLIEFGANLNATNKNGESPSDYLDISAAGGVFFSACLNWVGSREEVLL